MIFRRDPAGVEPDLLAIRIQPDEGISLTVVAKEPGPDLKLAPVTLDFKYGEVFGAEPPEAYERLLLDAIHGDATLYARGDWVEQAWALLEPVLEAWSRTPAALPTSSGSPRRSASAPFCAKARAAGRTSPVISASSSGAAERAVSRG